MAETTCQFNKEWFKRIGIYLAVFTCLLVAGFLIFNFKSQKSEPLPLKEDNPPAGISSQVNNSVESLSEEDLLLKEKIGQMIMVGFRGLALTDNPKLQKQIEEGSVGGVILFDYELFNKTYNRNIQNKEQLK